MGNKQDYERQGGLAVTRGGPDTRQGQISACTNQKVSGFDVQTTSTISSLSSSGMQISAYTDPPVVAVITPSPSASPCPPNPVVFKLDKLAIPAPEHRDYTPSGTASWSCLSMSNPYSRPSSSKHAASAISSGSSAWMLHTDIKMTNGRDPLHLQLNDELLLSEPSPSPNSICTSSYECKPFLRPIAAVTLLRNARLNNIKIVQSRTPTIGEDADQKLLFT